MNTNTQTNLNTIVKRGDIYLYNFGEQNGSIQSGLRPAVVISNAMANRYSGVVTVCPITSRFSKKELLTHVRIDYERCNMKMPSQILTEQIFTVNKNELNKNNYIGTLCDEDIENLNKALEVSIEVGEAEKMFEQNARQIKVAKEKAKSIYDLDCFIKMWLDKDKPIDMIYDLIEDRRAKENDLKKYCKDFNLDYTEYYRVSINEGQSQMRLVG